MIPYRADEKYWITNPGDGGVSFYVAFNFDNPTDIQLARILLLEFKDTRAVKGSVAISYHDAECPATLSQAFPDAVRDQFSNGIL